MSNSNELIVNKGYNMETLEKCWYEEYCQKHEDGCKDTCNRYHQVKSMIDYSEINPELWIGELKDSKGNELTNKQFEEIKSNIVNLIAKGLNLYICSSDIQCGKSTYSNRLVLKYFDEIWAGNQSESRGYFLYVPAFLNRFLSFESQETEEYKEISRKLYESDVVVWDNFTNRKLMKNEQELLETFIGYRYTYHKANIFNGLIPNDVYASLGNILVQRLQQCEIIELKKEGK